MSRIDTNGDGHIDVDEFMATVHEFEEKQWLAGTGIHNMFPYRYLGSQFRLIDIAL